MFAYDFTRYFDVGVVGIVTVNKFTTMSYHITTLSSRT